MHPPHVITGRYVNQRFIPDGPLPDADGTAQLVITPTNGVNGSTPRGSILDAVGSTAATRTKEDILEQVRAERDSWGER